MRIEKDNILKYIQKKSYIKRFFQFLLGCFIISVAYNVFIVPNNLIPGGTTGLAIIINNLFGINNSTFIFVTNIFLLVISYIFLGKEKTRNTILGSIIFPLVTILYHPLILLFPIFYLLFSLYETDVNCCLVSSNSFCASAILARTTAGT